MMVVMMVVMVAVVAMVEAAVVIETVVAVDTPVAAVEVVTIEVAGEATAEAVVEDTIVIKRILCRSMLDLVSITI